MRQRRLESDAEPRCCYSRSRRAILHRHNDCAAGGPFFCAATMALASIRKSGLEIKNRCTKEGLNREKLASIPKFGPEIKNRCTQEGLKGEKLASALDRQWRRKRVLMRPEAAFPYVFAAEGAQHPPKKPPRSTVSRNGCRRNKPPRPTDPPRSTKKEDDRGHPPVVLLESARIGPPG